MNFPDTTDAEIVSARRRFYWYAIRAGLPEDRAEDIAQDGLILALTRDWKRSPESLHHAASILLKRAKRYGIGALSNRETTSQRRAEKDRERNGEAPPHRETAPAYADPARVAEQAETVSYRRRLLAERLGVSPGELARMACGVAPPDEDEVSPTAVISHGPGYTPPTTGDRGACGCGDPNPASREASRMEAVNDWRRVAGLPPL